MTFKTFSHIKCNESKFMNQVHEKAKCRLTSTYR